MPVQDEVYTISEDDVLRSLQESARRKKDRVEPDWRPSPSVRGPMRSGGARPVIAASLSLFISGAGQAYNGQGKVGLLFFLMQAFGVAAHWAMIRLWPELLEMAVLFGWNEWQVFRGLVVIDFIFALLMLGGVLQAYRRAERDIGGFDGVANPLLAGFASIILPGWGQIVNGQIGKALVFLSGLLSGLYVAGLLMFTPLVRLLGEIDASQAMTDKATTVALAVLGTAGMLWVLSVYDALLIAGFRRRMS